MVSQHKARSASQPDEERMGSGPFGSANDRFHGQSPSHDFDHNRASYLGSITGNALGDGLVHDLTGQPAAARRRRDLMAGGRPRPIVPKSLSEAYRIAQAVCAAKMAPKGLDTPEACMIAIMHGLEVGLSPLSALQRIAVINGRPTIWGDGALALVKASGLCEAIDEWIEGDDPNSWVAVCNVIRRHDPVPIERRFSTDDAKRARLWGKSGPWSDYPKRMLQMRARAFALRDAFPDVLGGLYLTEEFLVHPTHDRSGEVQVDGPTAPPTHEAVNLGSQRDRPTDPLCDRVGRSGKPADQVDSLVAERKGFTEPQSNPPFNNEHRGVERHHCVEPHCNPVGYGNHRTKGGNLGAEQATASSGELTDQCKAASDQPQTADRAERDFPTASDSASPSEAHTPYAPAAVPETQTDLGTQFTPDTSDRSDRSDRSDAHGTPNASHLSEQAYPSPSNSPLPALAHLRRSRYMPREIRALRFRNPWIVKQPRASKAPPQDTPAQNSYVPLDDITAQLDLYDAALCCATDETSLLEIAEEFEERLSSLPRHHRPEAERIFEKHEARIAALKP